MESASRPADESPQQRPSPPVRADEIVPEPPKTAAVSLWHKIFGLPAEQTSKLSSSEAEAPDPIAAADPLAADATWTGFIESESDEPASREGTGDTHDEAEEDANDDRPRRRPRRRRRGGRKSGQQRDENQVASRGPARANRDADMLEDSDDDFGFDDEFGQAPVVATDSPRPDYDIDDQEDEDEDEPGRAGSTSKSAHRNIPSWQDAIGAIVDLNLQARSQRRPSSSGHGRSGQSRGRARGRRKKSS